MAYVGYIISPYTDESQIIAAGISEADVFAKTFARIAPEVNAFGGSDMAVQKKHITDEEALELEAICAEHLD